MDAITEAPPLLPTERTARLVDWLERQCGLKQIDRPQIDGSLSTSKLTLKATRSDPNVNLALRRLTEATKPAADEEIDVAFARIAVMCKRFTPGDDFSADLQLAEYRAGCRAYPADVALYVLNRWPSRHDEWPSWKALQDELDDAYAPRRIIMAALRTVEPYKPPAEDGPSDDDVAFVKAKCAETVAKLKDATKSAAQNYTAPQSRRRIGSKLSDSAKDHLNRISGPMEH